MNFRADGNATATTSISFSTISIPTGRSVKVGDLIIANSTYSYLYRVTAMSSTTATVTYLTSLRGATGANATTTAIATTSSAGLMSKDDKKKLDTMQNPIPVGVYFLGSEGLRHAHGENIEVNLNKTTKIYNITIPSKDGAYTFLPLSYNGYTIVFNNDYTDSRSNHQIDCYIRTLDSSSKQMVDTGFIMFRFS